MKKVLAKLKVGSVQDFGNNNHEVNMTPVTSDSPENKTFSQYTPSGSIKLLINNPDTIGFFKAGEEYYAEFMQYQDSKLTEHNVHNNALAFGEWLTSQNIEHRGNGHFTTIIGEHDMFALGVAWEKYRAANQPKPIGT